ncbi:MAG: DUF4270 family protein [Bacteroidales bacterium]|nr:DUF4270 family protein [Bacteroidales bacterium]
MNNKINAGFFALYAFLLSFSILSCDDEPFSPGSILVPDSGEQNVLADTFSIECYTVEGLPGYAYMPSTTTSSDKAPLGLVFDPVFGKTAAEVILKFNYNSGNYYGYNGYSPSDTYVSCKLYLNTDSANVYGGSNGFDVDIHTLKKSLSSTFPTNYSLKSDEYNFDQSVSTSTSHKFRAVNNTITGIDSGKYYLVVELDKAFAQNFMDSAYIEDNSVYSIYFNTFYPGFYLKPKLKNLTGGIENFYYVNSMLVLEYTRTYDAKDGSDSIVTKYSTFSVSDYQCLYQNESNYMPNGPFGNIIGDTLNQHDFFYVQSMGGVRGYIKIPQLDLLKEKSNTIGINLAELVFPVNSNYVDTTNFYNPARLTIKAKINSSGAYASIYDDARSAFYYNGFFNKQRLDYRINLTEHVQKYILGETLYNSFYLMAAKGSYDSESVLDYKTPGRIVLNSGNNLQPSYLRIIYTKIN